jgi:HEAT repeat protein
MDRRLVDRARTLSCWLAVAAVAATLTFAIDRWRVVVLSKGHARLRWIHEVTLWSGHALLAMAVLALGAFAVAVARRAVRPRDGGAGLPMWRHVVLATAVAYLPLAWPLHWVGTTLASGPWVSEQSFAGAVRWAPLVAGPLGVGALLWLGTLRAGRSRRSALATVAAGVGLALFAAADHVVAPGLYPEFHLITQVLASASAVILGARLLAPRWTDAPRWLRTAGWISALACVAAPLAWFGMAASTRSALVLRSAVARDWIRMAMPERPSTLLRDVLAELDPKEGRYSVEREAVDTSAFGRSRDWNVVLVVADTLRADALPPARPPEGTEFAQPGDTPRLDAWIEGAYRFNYVYSAATETKRAMPAMFRSIEASDDPITTGIPLGSRMETIGLEPVAVVHRYFMPAKYPPVAALLDGFADVRVYENPKTNTAVPQALELAKGLGDRQFFMFLHLYTVHVPGFDGKVLGSGDGSRVEKYRKSLQYLDGQFGALLDGLGELGLADNTIVVFVADHGEGLGDHGQMLHGPTAFEEDVRVPLAIAVPGHEGRQIDETVGTIDLAPTLVDLLGAAAGPGDSGRSLVPLLMEEPREPERPYYFENNKGTTIGVVIGHDKLIYERKVDVAYRFDVVSDPDEHDDLHDPNNAIDRKLLRTLVQFKPEIAAEELEEPATLELLRQRLTEVDPSAPGSALPLLVRLVELEPKPELVERCGEIFDESADPAVRLLIARHLLDRAPKTLGPRMVTWLDDLQERPEAELQVIDALGLQGQGEFAEAKIAARMQHYAASEQPATWVPWLRLIRPWKTPAKSFGPALVQMLTRARTLPSMPSATLELVLEAAGDVTGAHASTAELVSGARALLEHPEPRVRAAAVRVLGSLGAKSDADAVEDALKDKKEDIRVRREAAAALSSLLGDDALPMLDEVSRQAAMTTLVVRHLRDEGTMQAVPVLERIAKREPNGDTRVEAKKAIEAIEARAGKKRPKKKKAKAKPKPKPRAKPATATEG